MDYKNKSVLFYDYGLCVEYASRLSRDFGQVFYYSQWEASFPKSNLALVGEGMEGITRVLNFWDYVDKADLICCFDTYCGDIVEFLRKRGYRVFGAGRAEIIENNRWQSRQLQEKLGLPTQHTVKLTGIEKLIDYLKTHKKMWVKINTFRGDIETFWHEDYDETEAQFLGKLMVETGAKGKVLEFVVEEELDGLEPGYDGWVVDGKYPPITMWGFEKKGTGYIGKVQTDSSLPPVLKNINTALAPILASYKARTMFSTEFIVSKKDKKGYLIDPCVRAPMPVGSAIHCEMWKNFADIIWNAAEGKIVAPQPVAKYGAGICFESDWAAKNWTLVEFPPEYRQWVKLRMAFRTKNGKYYSLPGFSSLGSVIGLGSTVDEAISKVKTYTEKLKAKELVYTISGLEDIQKDILPESSKYGLGVF